MAAMIDHFVAASSGLTLAYLIFDPENKTGVGYAAAAVVLWTGVRHLRHRAAAAALAAAKKDDDMIKPNEATSQPSNDVADEPVPSSENESTQGFEPCVVAFDFDKW